MDRLWPRGVTRDHAALEEWLKDAAPSPELRRWYGHDVDRFDEFRTRYQAELHRLHAREAVEHMLEVARPENVVLLTATRDVDHSGARVFLDHLNVWRTR